MVSIPLRYPVIASVILPAVMGLGPLFGIFTYLRQKSSSDNHAILLEADVARKEANGN